MYKFVFGASGAGKTYKVFQDCIKSSKEDKNSLFLVITPEQSTTSAEKEICRLTENHATESIDVVSFNRLAYKVFAELDIKNPEVLDDISKAMILKRIVEEHSGELVLWSRKSDKPGFIDNLKSTVSELYQYGITPDDIKSAYENADRAQLRNKMHDLYIIYDAFKSFISDKYITTEEIPDVLCRLIPQSEIIKHANIVLDGFTGFTPVQYRIIENFLTCAKSLTITVSIGDEENPYSYGDRYELFSMSKEIVKRVTDLADRNGICAEKHVRVSKNSSAIYRDNPDMNYLESHLLRYDKCSTQLTADSIRLVKAVGLKKEIRYVSGEILKHVRNSGTRYRDIAIVSAGIESYEVTIKDEFGQLGIPFYFDRNLGLSDNPLVLMISAIFDIIDSDYSYDSIMRYLRTGLISDDQPMTDIMDIYMFECGKRGYRRVSSSWDYKSKRLGDISLEDLNAYKDSILLPLEKIREAFREKKTVGEIIDLLQEHLELYSCEKKMQTRAEQFEAVNDKVRQREYNMAYEKVTELLQRMKELTGDNVVTADELRQLFAAGIEQIQLGMIPSGADEVIIGDITRTRLDDIKLLFVIGASEGNIPKLSEKTAIITDNDRESLRHMDIELAPGLKEDLYIQRYYLYRLLTKPARRLYISYASKDMTGNDNRPSYLLAHIKSIFNGLEINEAEDAVEIISLSDAYDKVITYLRETRIAENTINDSAGESLFAYLRDHEDYCTQIYMLTAAAFYRNNQLSLSEEGARALYGNFLNASFSGIDAFVSCPYKYYMQYGLKLDEVKQFSIDALDIGNITHATIEKIFSRAKRNGIDIANIDDEARTAMVESCIAEAIEDDASFKYSDTSRNGYIIQRVKKIVDRSMWALIYQLKNGDFKPYEAELGFSYRDGLSSLKYDLGDGLGLGLTGKVDRVDLCEDGDTLVKIIDYKSSDQKWSLSDIIAGKKMQLIIYMQAVREMLKNSGKESIPAAMLYFTVQDPILSDEDDESELNEKLLAAMRPTGLVNSSPDVLKHLDVSNESKSLVIPVVQGKDGYKKTASIADEAHIDMLSEYVQDKVKKIGTRILHGEADISPAKDTCKYCAYRSICGFDKKVPGFKERYEKSYKLEDAWEEIKGNDIQQ